MKTIIVPIDFSPIAMNAARYAADMARNIGANIILLHNVVLPIVISEIPVSTEVVDEMMEDAKNSMESAKSVLVASAESKVNVSSVITTGILIDEINALADQFKPFMVVMGTRGEGAAPGWLIGSNALDALHRLAYPTLIIPEHVQFRMLRKIALACDLHNVSDTIPVPALESLVETFNSSVDILYVSTPNGQSKELITESESLRNILAKFHPEFHFLTGEYIVDAIVEYIREEETDLLIVVPKKRNFISALFHKSISNDVANHIALPIMSLHKESH